MTEELTLRLAPVIPDLLRRYASDGVKIAALAEIPQFFDLSVYHSHQLTKVCVGSQRRTVDGSGHVPVLGSADQVRCAGWARVGCVALWRFAGSAARAIAQAPPGTSLLCHLQDAERAERARSSVAKEGGAGDHPDRRRSEEGVHVHVQEVDCVGTHVVAAVRAVRAAGARQDRWATDRVAVALRR